MRKRRGEVERSVLWYFLTEGEGYAYDFMKKLDIGSSSTAHDSFKKLEGCGLIYRARMEKGERSYRERLIYRLTFMGFAEALRIFNEPDILQKAFSTHSDLCPAIFNELTKSGDPDLLRAVTSIIIKWTPRYFYDATGLADTLGFEEYRLAAPFIYCSMIFDAMIWPFYWRTIEKIFGGDITELFFNRKTPSIMLTLGTIEHGFLLWELNNDRERDSAGRSEKNRCYLKKIKKFAIRRISGKKLEALEQEVQKGWQEYYEKWSSWLMHFNPRTNDPRKLLEETRRMRREIAIEEVRVY